MIGRAGQRLDLTGNDGKPFAGLAGPAGAQVEDYAPVTDALLREPPPADWLSWRRTLDGQGHSPLDQITPENIGRLRLAWSGSLGPGSQQTTAMVRDGVLYIANPGEVVQALDAATGDFLWEYRRDAPEPGNSYGGPPPGRAHRNIAIWARERSRRRFPWSNRRARILWCSATSPVT